MSKNNQKLVPGEYIVNVEKKTVVYSVVAHGRVFVGVANCGEHDAFDEQTGKAIAHMRAVLQQRKFDLGLTRRCIHNLKGLVAYELETYGVASPHYMRAIQAASEEQKAQLEHIRQLNARIDAYK